MASPAIEMAETIQTASINRAPSPHHDLNPSTAASVKQPVTVSSRASSPAASSRSIPLSAVHPTPRRTAYPPLPDLRFEQSYLASISQAETRGRVVWITVRDQMLLPLIQGTMWTLVLLGWRSWNKGAELGGRSIGGRIRKWWWGVNNWQLPEEQTRRTKAEFAQQYASEVADYYTDQFSSAGQD
ncbi:MAG: hypothetical protein M1817_006419 [Caeruleum heppii]|nr:MAG: hypothetical protein M1817_006419 [Caeruleum heppii]